MLAATQSETAVPPKTDFETWAPKTAENAGKTSPSSGLQIQLPQASGKRREFDLKEGKFVCNLNYENRGGERWIRTRDTVFRTA